MATIPVVASVFVLSWLGPVNVARIVKGDAVPPANFMVQAVAATHLVWHFVLRNLS